VAADEVLARVADLFRGSEDEQAASWHSAAAELANSDDPQASSRVEAALTASDDDLRRAAVYVLSLRGEAGAQILIEVARTAEYVGDREYALMCLSYNAPTDAAVEAVIAASVVDPSPHVRRMTREFLAYNLVGVRKRDPKPRLHEFMRQGGLVQRYRALQALRRVEKQERFLKRVQLSGWRWALWIRFRRIVSSLREWRAHDN
jgi:hypothetical protein